MMGINIKNIVFIHVNNYAFLDYRWWNILIIIKIIPLLVFKNS